MVLAIDVLDRWGRQATAEVTVRAETVELKMFDTVVGIADRDYLRQWLRHPEGVYAYDEMAWLTVADGIALAIDDMLPPWVLDNHVLSGLRECI
jgi:hypothetical protein